MAGYLDNYGAGDERREKRNRWLLILGGAALVLLFFWFVLFVWDKTEILRAQFKRIFDRAKTGYAALDSLLRRLLRLEDRLMRVLERPEIPLHTNDTESERTHSTSPPTTPNPPPPPVEQSCAQHSRSTV